MTDYFKSIRKLGRTLNFRSAEQPGGRAAVGLIEPMDERDGNFAVPTRPGVQDTRRYLLIAAPEAMREGETEVVVTADGREYELLRAEPARVGENIGHWEGVLRLKGGRNG